jgi:hypothetical protein
MNRLYTNVIVNGHRADHILNEVTTISGGRSIRGVDINAIGSLVAHEFAHALGLGDEYEGNNLGSEFHQLLENQTDTQDRILARHNLTHHYAVNGTAGEASKIDMNLVKWSRWHRIEKASILIEGATLIGGNRLSLKVSPGDRLDWLAATKKNVGVFLRTRQIDYFNVNDPKPRSTLAGPLKLEEFRSDGTVIVSGSSTTIFKANDVLYLPQLLDGEQLTVFLPSVLKHLTTTRQPFAKKSDISKANTGAAYPDYFTDPAFPGGKFPRDLTYVVGVYEGGGTYNSLVYRPSGTCRMRNQNLEVLNQSFPILDDPLGVGRAVVSLDQFLPFCYVCKYSLVNQVNPAKLHMLSYPE